MSEHDELERRLAERGQSQRDEAWISPSDAEALRADLRASARAETPRRPWRHLLAIAAALAVTTTAGLWYVQRPLATTVHWRLLDAEGRPVQSIERSSATGAPTLESVLVELTLPEGAAVSSIRIHAAGPTPRVLSGEEPIEFPEGGGTRAWLIELPNDLGERVELELEIDGRRLSLGEISRATQ